SIKENGEIEIKTEFLEPDMDFLQAHSLKSTRYLKLSIRDTGEGIDDEIKRKIFDPFFSIKKKGKGSGLGLASAYGIIKNHEGTLIFESEKFIGSVFIIYLPSQKCTEAISEEFKVNNLKTDRGQILIVDDEKMVLDAMSNMLTSLGYKSLKTEKGEIAIDVFNNNPNISLVILDMILPGMDGSKIFTELKKINPKVKVLISSGYSMSKKVEELLINGAKGFIEKPFSMEELSVKVRDIIDGN
ncbi:MAG: response regulator, partial [Candidatus Delongbacteria bacterium]|nr:response regulator [Candidatus Delongbacteria bacterium]